MSGVNIGVVGCAGRMGQMIIREADAAGNCTLTAASERPGHPDIGKDASVLSGLEPSGVEIAEDAGSVFANSDVVVDFTIPAVSVDNTSLAVQHKTALVLGTTGFDSEQEKAIESAAQEIPIVWAPNMSLGVNLLFALTQKVARTLSDDWDIEIVEMHHKHKVDAPSGTALGLGRAAAEGRNVDLEKVMQSGRHGHTGARRKGDIGFATLRGGDVAGDHSVIFAVEGERIELTHKAGTRAVFARGAVRAATWAKGRDAGLYTMFDVLDLDA